ncbi:MAG: WG repeat-containing protein [Oscillospiraceae bacterium]|jgi:hypothetical protein|nr:WG repeat-containing protein [Oscillospiraceae bacterium]
MKRLLIALLVAALLGACASVSAPPTETMPAETSPVEAAPPGAAGIYMPEVEKLPELAPFRVDEKYTRREEGPMPELKPGDYGEIYPYIGSVGGLGDSSYKLGFATADGEIVCDDAYTNVKAFEYEGERVYVFIKGATGKMYMAASDGGFVAEFDDVMDGGEGTFAVKIGDKWGVADYAGELIIPCEFERAPRFREGLAAVTRDFASGFEYIDKTGKTVLTRPAVPFEWIDHLNIVGLDAAHLSFFHMVSFSEGLAAFFDGEKYGYMDAGGNVVIPASWDVSVEYGYFPSPFSNGFAEIYDAVRGAHRVIDKTGREFDTYEIKVPEGDGYYYWYPGKNDKDYYDGAGNPVAETFGDGSGRYYDATGAIAGEWDAGGGNYVGGGWVALYGGEDSVMLKDGRSVVSEGFLRNIILLPGDRFVGSFRIDEESPEGETVSRYVDRLFDGEGNILLDFGGEYRYSDDYVDAFYGMPLKEGLIRIRTDGWPHNNGLLDIDGNIVLEPVYETIYNFGEYYAVRRGHYGGIVDGGGEWVVKLALFDSAAD